MLTCILLFLSKYIIETILSLEIYAQFPLDVSQFWVIESAFKSFRRWKRPLCTAYTCGQFWGFSHSQFPSRHSLQQPYIFFNPHIHRGKKKSIFHNCLKFQNITVQCYQNSKRDHLHVCKVIKVNFQEAIILTIIIVLHRCKNCVHPLILHPLTHYDNQHSGKKKSHKNHQNIVKCYPKNWRTHGRTPVTS